ncbi:hypothetical protein P4S72_03035 [Vibrio sp. PP-XX7]
MPYCHADPVLCKRLEAVGCAAVMPLGAPIGSNQGLVSEAFLKSIIEQSCIPVVIDAGIGGTFRCSESDGIGGRCGLGHMQLPVLLTPSP